MIRTITIGDIHGKDIWKSFADLGAMLENPNLTPQYNYYIFVGDYTDDYYIKHTTIKHNLLEIVKLKSNYPDHIILLLGNHDIPYYTSNLRELSCSGTTAHMLHDYHKIFNDNDNFFQAAFQIDNYIWTHAGIHKGWYEYVFLKDKKTLNLFKLLEVDVVTTPISDLLNIALKFGKKSNNNPIYDCSFHRYGSKRVGGILWADKNETYKKPLGGYHQIIGHSKVKNIKSYPKNKNTSVTYVDCLDTNDEFYELIIKKGV